MSVRLVSSIVKFEQYKTSCENKMSRDRWRQKHSAVWRGEVLESHSLYAIFVVSSRSKEVFQDILLLAITLAPLLMRYRRMGVKMNDDHLGRC
jgi:hypothetical protein